MQTSPPRNSLQASGRLRPGAVGLIAVLAMALANAAPITAMTGNVPVSVGFGNGTGAPAGFLVATVVLSVFAVGYVAMARHITATGSFYGFVSHGLGQAWGLAAGLLATVAYVVFEASLIGIFSSFARSTVISFGGPAVSWIWYALGGIAAVGALGYLGVSLSGKVLGVFLVAEVVLLSVLALRILAGGGGPNGLMVGSLNPLNAFKAAPASADGAVVGSAGIGLFFAFWSWVGFETTAVYGEESREPRKIVPRATLIAVIGLGLFYTFVSWMVIAHAGTSGALSLARGANPFDLFFAPTRHLLGSAGLHAYQVLTVCGSFACALAFHNAAARYVYAMGRDGLSPRLAGTLAATSSRHGSPHVASGLQSAVTLVITLLFFGFQHPTPAAPDVPYTYLYGLMAIAGTMMILIVQCICSIAVVVYFHVARQHPQTAHWWRTLVAPSLGAVGMGYVVYLLGSHLDFAAGAASTSPVFAATPWIVLTIFVVGLVAGLVLRARAPQRYALIGRTVLVETASD